MNHDAFLDGFERALGDELELEIGELHLELPAGDIDAEQAGEAAARELAARLGEEAP